ncbi:MAG: response regulator [Ignavibacteria bacterium]|nr:response regulator [Ignavibacteria bacterium]
MEITDSAANENLESGTQSKGQARRKQSSGQFTKSSLLEKIAFLENEIANFSLPDLPLQLHKEKNSVSEGKQKNVLDFFPVPVLLIDSDLHITNINTLFNSLLLDNAAFVQNTVLTQYLDESSATRFKYCFKQHGDDWNNSTRYLSVTIKKQQQTIPVHFYISEFTTGQYCIVAIDPADQRLFNDDSCNLQTDKFEFITVLKQLIKLCEIQSAKKQIKIQYTGSSEEFHFNAPLSKIWQIFETVINEGVTCIETGDISVEAKQVHNETIEFLEISIRIEGEFLPEKSLLIKQAVLDVDEVEINSSKPIGAAIRLLKEISGSFSFTEIGEHSWDWRVKLPLYHIDKSTMLQVTDLLDLDRCEDQRNSFVTFKALYVDDDPISLRLAQIVLKDLCMVDCAKNSKEALEKVAVEKYDIILMDINLGKDQMDGVKLTGMIRQKPEYSKIPLVALTAYPMDEEMSEFLSNGCDYYISKPYSRNLLREIVTKTLVDAKK